MSLFLAAPAEHSAREILGLMARVSALVLLAAALLWLAQRRWKLLTRFLAEPRSALDLAIFRIALMMTYLVSVDPRQVLRFSALNPALIVPPTGWGHLATWFPRNLLLVEIAEVAFFAFAVLTLVGLWTRISTVLAVATGFYLFTLPQLFGKINHVHDMVLFGLLLACSPSGDALSIDSLMRKRRDDRIPMLATSLRYAQPLQAVMVLMGITYFFPGAWKLSRLGFEWFRPNHLQTLIANKVAESSPTHFQAWMLHQPSLLSIGALFTIVFEMGWIFFVIPRRTRPIAILMGLGFHNMTNLMMNIPFWSLQFCYVALVDWGGVLAFFSSHFRSLRASARQWVYVRRGWANQTLGPSFRNLAGVLTAAMIVAGIGHAVSAWPIACYPTFDSATITPQPPIATLELHSESGAISNQTLSYDQALQAIYHPEIWRGMTEVEGYPGKSESEPRARALVALWQGVHPQADLVSVTLYCDTYELNAGLTRQTQHRKVRTLQLLLQSSATNSKAAPTQQAASIHDPH